MSLTHVIIYTDGGAKPNPGPGGWAALCLYPDGREVPLSGGLRDTTNNQMELTAVCEALESLDAACQVTLYTDSTYVRNGITKWIHGWKKKQWRGSKDEPVKNVALWQRLDDARARHRVDWQWVRGHAGDTHNERVDRMATAARQAIQSGRAPDPAAAAAIDRPADPIAPTAERIIYVAAAFDFKAKRGAWAALIVTPTGETVLTDRLGLRGSVQQGVLEAARRALESLDAGSAPDVVSDQDYLVKGMTQWVTGWQKKDWKTAKGEPVKNRGQWEGLLRAAEPHQPRWLLTRANDPQISKALAAARTALST